MPPPYVLTVIAFQQKARTLYITMMSGAEINEMAHVATLNQQQLNNPNYYQRQMLNSKITEIRDWWDNADSFLTNAVVLSFDNRAAFPAPGGAPVPNLHALHVNYAVPALPGPGVITINPWAINPDCILCASPMNNSVCSNGACGYCEKPGLVIDGQHRVRGTAASANSAELIPVVIVSPNSFSVDEIGQQFIEQNSTASNLDKFTTMHLQKRFSNGPFLGNLANQRAYDLVMELNTAGGINPWNGEIRIIKGQNNKIVDLPTMFEWIQDATAAAQPPAAWGLDGMTLAASRNRLRDFYAAIRDAWPGNWNNPAYNLSAPKKSTGVAIFSLIFEHIHQRAGVIAGGPAVTKANFDAAIAAMVPIIDWSQPIYGTFARTSTRGLMMDIIKQWFPVAGGVVIPNDPATGAPWASLHQYLTNAIPEPFTPTAQIEPYPTPAPIVGVRYEVNMVDNPRVVWTKSINALATHSVVVRDAAGVIVRQATSHMNNGMRLSNLHLGAFTFTPGDYDIEFVASTPVNQLLSRTLLITVV